MPRELTEAEAWRHIAKLIEKGEWEKYGLCCEIVQLCFYGDKVRITSEVKEQMQRRLKYHMALVEFYLNAGTTAEEGPWAFRMGEADVRILAAYILALDAEDFPNA